MPWLGEFRILVPEAAKRAGAPGLDYGEVERAFEGARQRMQVGPDELRILEQKATKWSYWLWWPPLSHTLAAPIKLPEQLKDERVKREAIKLLYERIKHIEVVSVILRFLCPEQFGIISPPVVAILNLVPKVGEEHVDHYLRYTGQLLDMVTHYKKVLPGAADVDMALWSAAHLRLDTKYKPLADDMRADEYFQEARLRNLLEGLGLYGLENNQQRLLFARSLVDRDYLSAAAIAARVFEGVLDAIGRRLGIDKWKLPRGPNESATGALVHNLDRREEIRELGVKPGDLATWWDCRDGAIHPDRGISKENAEKFVRSVDRLWRNHGTWKRK
jgi:hypothetical protein